MKPLRHLLHFWHTPPWQTPFYAEARGHSLRTRIGRLLEPSQIKENRVTRLAIAVALVALLTAAMIRVELVAQEPSKAAATEQTPAAVAKPSPPKIRREELRYDDKSFEEWRRVFQIELKPARRIEAIKAMYVFSRQGYAEEATDAMLEILPSVCFDNVYATELGEVRKTLIQVVSDIDAEVVTPRVVTLLDAKNDHSVRTAALEILRGVKPPTDESKNVLATLAKSDEDLTIRSWAFEFLLLMDRDNPQLLEIVREQIANPPKEIGDEVNAINFAIRRAARHESGLGSSSTHVTPALLPILIDGLKHPDESVRECAIDAMSHISNHIRGLLPQLLQLSRDSDPTASAAAQQALLTFQAASPFELQSAFDGLEADDRVTLLTVIEQLDLAKRPEQRQQTLKFLLRLKKDPDERVQKRAAEMYRSYNPSEDNLTPNANYFMPAQPRWPYDGFRM